MIARRTLLAAAAAFGTLNVLTLTGCVLTPPSAKTWRGRFSLRATDLSGRTQAQTGRFELLDAPALSRLDLLTPLSGILARIEITPTGASFRRSLTEEAEEDHDVDALCRRLIGFPLPVEALFELLRAGATAPNTSASEEWRCRIQERMADGTPKRLRIERTSAPPLTLVILLEESAE